MDEPTVSDTPSGLRPGSRFGHYRLKRLLGRGGYGEVYEAEDTLMDRAVALKLLAAPYSQNQAFRQRLYREARNAGKLHEPHVVPIHHCGEIDGQLYIDMRLIEGSDLQKVLARDGPLSPVRAVAIVRQIAAALDAAHSVQMVHRDIKPANILLTGDDFACLVDFGLANAATDAKLTSSGTTIGTFAYMAPERFSNTDVSHRADIYALACVLYECLTGSPPYPTSDLPALINAHLTAPIPRPSQHRQQIPAGFDEVIAAGMAKNPKDRFDSASDLAAVARHALRPAGQRQADAIVASTQAARQPDHPHAAATAKPPTGSPAKTPRPAAKPASSPTKTRLPAKPARSPAKAQRPAAKPPARSPTSTHRASPALLFLQIQRQRPAAITLAAVATLALIGLVITVIVGNDSPPPSAPSSPPPQPPAPSASPSQIWRPQAEVPFYGLDGSTGVAVDSASNVYVANLFNNRVLKLLAGSDIQVELPFTGLNGPSDAAVDTAGTVYVTDDGNNRVLELQAGSTTQVELPFAGLADPDGVAVDTAGNVYVADQGNHRVLKLPAGSTTQVELPFTGLSNPADLAVDTAGTLYVADFRSQRVLKLPAGSTTQVELPFSSLKDPYGVAVDTAGNVYVAEFDNSPATRVLELLARSTTQVELPFTGLGNLTGVAVDTAGNVYVSDRSKRVLKLPVGQPA